MNWSQYNKNLIKRGNINLWLSEDITNWWYPEGSCGRGRPLVYSDRAIETCLTIAYLFGMPLRMTEGFINSLFARERLQLQVPSYSQLSRRAQLLQLPEIKVKRGERLHLAFDSTGLKVFGEGEWKVRTHGASKRRTWRKLHIAVDIDTLLIAGVKLTENSATDAEVGAEILQKNLKGALKV